jgi:hypothetical protein
MANRPLLEIAKELWENRSNGRCDGMSDGKGGRVWLDGERASGLKEHIQQWYPAEPSYSKEPRVVLIEETRQTVVVVPIVFQTVSFNYYSEEQCYMCFDSIWLPPSDEVAKAILAAADMQFSHMFRCVEVTSDDDQGYCQIAIRPLHGDNLLERLQMAEMEVNDES